MIGYYVHHQGDGHRQRAVAIAGSAHDPIVLLGTGLQGKCADRTFVDIADDRPASSSRQEQTSPFDCLHYAPLRHAGVRERTAQIIDWIARLRPRLMVIDVSVEVAMLARLASVPTVYVRLGGRREDAGHLQAFRGALRLLAPFHEDLDEPSVPDWVRHKTWYVPGLTRASAAAVPIDDLILVVNGRGGGILDGETIAAAAAATPTHAWRVIGPISAPSVCPSNLELCGWVDHADEEIGRAGIVVGTGGDGVVSAVIAAGRPFVCLPQQRPYDEQLSKARRLATLGAAVVLEHMPLTSDWPAILDRVRSLDPSRLTRLHDPHGLAKAANLLHELAGE